MPFLWLLSFNFCSDTWPPWRVLREKFFKIDKVTLFQINSHGPKCLAVWFPLGFFPKFVPPRILTKVCPSFFLLPEIEKLILVTGHNIYTFCIAKYYNSFHILSRSKGVCTIGSAKNVTSEEQGNQKRAPKMSIAISCDPCRKFQKILERLPFDSLGVYNMLKKQCATIYNKM